MKLFKRIFLSVLIVLTALVVAPKVIPGMEANSVQAATVAINASKLTLNVGEKYTLKIEGTNGSVKWKTSDSNIVAVNSKGKVLAQKAGTATVVGKVNGKKYKCVITVEKPKLNKTKLTMNVSEAYYLKVSGTSQKIKWYSNDSNIAAVSSKGKITAVKKGTATITAKIGTSKYKCTVTVENPRINLTSKSLSVGEKAKLTVAGTTQNVTWSTSDKSIVAVNSKGTIAGVKKGSAYVTAKVGQRELYCYVKVEAFQYSKNITAKYLATGTSVVGIFTNNNSCAVSFRPKMMFYDSKGKLQSTASDFNYCFEPNTTIALEFNSYNPDTYKSQSFASYKLDMGLVEKSSYKTGSVGKIQVTSTKKNNYVTATVTNKSKNKLDTVQIAIIFYDSNNKIIGYNYTYASCSASGSSADVNLYYPYDSNYNTIKPASYKIYVNHAYAYEN